MLVAMKPRHRRLLIPGLLVLLIVVVVVASLTGRADGETTEVTRVSDPRITESSGLAVSLADPDLAYTINDSGSAPEIYAVRLSTGETAGVTRLDGVTWFDPEALTIDSDGTLWVADTGDNGRQRQKPMLYALPEPGATDGAVTPTTYLLRHPTGPVDIEAIAADPDGGLVLVTKGLLGGELLRIEEPLRTDGANPTVATGVEMPALVTDAVFAAPGRLAVRTYQDIEVFAAGESVARLDTPPAEQAETIAVLGDGALLVGSEGVGQPLHRVTWSAPKPDVTRTGTIGVEDDDGEVHDARWVPWAVAGAVLVAAIGLIVRRRARR